MDEIKVKACAKINLSLMITGVMADGYHDLDTVMCPLELADYITLERRKDNLITCIGVDIPDEDNTAVKAAFLIMEEFKTSGVNIIIEKNIPLAAGLGGSSADAAGVLYGMSLLFELNYNSVKFFARQIGSDVSFLMEVGTGAMRARGRGDILTEESIEPLDILLVKPIGGVNTSAAYKTFDKLGLPGGKGDNEELVKALRMGGDICPYLVNDLYIPAVELNKEIAPVYERLKELNGSCAVMSGSGSALIAVCKSSEASEALADKLPANLFKLVTRTCKKALY